MQSPAQPSPTQPVPDQPIVATLGGDPLSPVQLSLKELPSAEALDQARHDIQTKLSEQGSRLAQLNWGIMRNAAGKALRDALGKLDLLEYVAGAWCTAMELRELAKKTLKAPGTEDTLALGEHEPSITQIGRAHV